jgi:hypothetical protein
MGEKMRHELKTWPEFFEQTLNGRKMFELRKNDRNFQVGDELLLQEWIPEHQGKGYTGRAVLVQVDSIFTYDDAIPG